MNIVLYLLMLMQVQDPAAEIGKIDEALAKNATSISAVLGNAAYMKWHTNNAFRAVIKKHAKQGPVTLVTKDEQGIRTAISGRLISGNKPLANTLLYVYQTDHLGSYGPEGNARPVLFAYLRTNEQGRFEFETIRPGSYPNSNIQQHIHLEAYDAGGRPLTVTELLFDDDPVLKGQNRANAIKAGFIISKGKDRFWYDVVVDGGRG